MHILITGGAGFIGSHVADHLIEHGHTVRALDALVPQVHGGTARPGYLHADVELIRGDVRDEAVVARALRTIDAVFHFAARVGVGQSMYEIAQYTSANEVGTAVLLEQIIKHPVGRLVVASSMSVYGEGRYRAPGGALVDDVGRDPRRLRAGAWDPALDGAPLEPVPTPETKPPTLASVYALSKFQQERLSLLIGGTYGIPTVALRFFNVYGTRQALSNPYTGVLAIFAARLLNDQPPLVFEDGRQMRDFVSVRDVATACRLALERPAALVAGRAINVGSGEPQRVAEVAAALASTLGVDVSPDLTGRYRAGDIRHCFADLTLAREALGYRPAVSFRDGLVELASWLVDQAPDDRVALASRELERRGLSA